MKLKLKDEEVGLVIYALRPKAFEGESEALRFSAGRLQRKITTMLENKNEQGG